MGAITDHASELSKAVPPVAVAGVTICGLTLEQWVYVTTILYTLAQFIWFIYKKVYPEIRRAINDRQT